MGKQFELKLINRTPGDWVIILITIGFIATINYAGTLLISGERLPFWRCILSTFGSVYVAFRLLRKRMVYRAIVSVKLDRVIVQDITAETAVSILFAEVAIYQYRVVRDVYRLIFKMTSGTKLMIAANANFGKIGDFDGLVGALEQAAAQFRIQNTAVMLRDESFF